MVSTMSLEHLYTCYTLNDITVDSIVKQGEVIHYLRYFNLSLVINDSAKGINSQHYEVEVEIDISVPLCDDDSAVYGYSGKTC